MLNECCKGLSRHLRSLKGSIDVCKHWSLPAGSRYRGSTWVRSGSQGQMGVDCMQGSTTRVMPGYWQGLDIKVKGGGD